MGCFMIKAVFYHVGLFLGLLFVTFIPCKPPSLLDMVGYKTSELNKSAQCISKLIRL